MDAKQGRNAGRGAAEMAPQAAPELVLTRVFEAPRALVFAAWTQAEHLAHWFGPHDVEMPFCELTARPGGVIHFCHQFASGQRLWVKGVFQEVQAPERLVFTHGFVDAEGRPGRPPMFADWPLEAVYMTTVILAEHPRGTLLTVRQSVAPAGLAASAVVAEERRMAREGWLPTLERLAEHLARMA
jgi:uncharacterized protein YndB with AHSA1/START domain